MTPTWPQVLTDLVARRDLDADAASWAMSEVLSGNATPVQIAGLAVALRAKGETVDELTGLSEAMLEHARPVDLPTDAVDIVGTGGDRANTVNISTMAAMVAVAAGAKTIKHGNRAASSACGTADVLEALGLVLDLQPEQQRALFDELGIVFLFAAHYHPALRHAATARRELGISTSFNFLGPLANPAKPEAQAVGVADQRMAELMAGVLTRRGRRGLVFHGGDGLDELTTTTTSDVWTFADGDCRRCVFDPADVGIARAQRADLVGGGPEHNAQVVRETFAGRPGAVRDIVSLNAAAAMLAYEGPDPQGDVTAQLGSRLERVHAAIDGGAAERLLQRWVEASRSAAE